jgi:hypothetical protein
MMGPGETIAAVALAGIVIGVLILLGTVFQRFMAYKERQLTLTADRTAEKAAQYASHIQLLEERVRVLECIATDRGAELAQQIDGLRDVEPSRPMLEERSA